MTEAQLDRDATSASAPHPIGFQDDYTGAVPEEAWRAAFETQATRKTLDRLFRIARARLQVYLGRHREPSVADVEDVVAAVLADTWSGRLSWDPAKRTLLVHLSDAIKFRVRNEAPRLWRQARHVAIEHDDDSESIADQIDPIAHRARVANDNVAATVARDSIAAVRASSNNDPDIGLVLDAFEAGITDRPAVINRVQMTSARYRNTMRRLRRLVHGLPNYLRDQVIAVLS